MTSNKPKRQRRAQGKWLTSFSETSLMMSRLLCVDCPTHSGGACLKRNLERHSRCPAIDGKTRPSNTFHDNFCLFWFRLANLCLEFVIASWWLESVVNSGPCSMFVGISLWTLEKGYHAGSWKVYPTSGPSTSSKRRLAATRLINDARRSDDQLSSIAGLSNFLERLSFK